MPSDEEEEHDLTNMFRRRRTYDGSYDVQICFEEEEEEALQTTCFDRQRTEVRS